MAGRKAKGGHWSEYFPHLTSGGGLPWENAGQPINLIPKHKQAFPMAAGASLAETEEEIVDNRSTEWILTDADDVQRGRLVFDPDEGQVRLEFYDADGTTRKSVLVLGSTNIQAEASNSVDYDLFGGGFGGHATVSAAAGGVGTVFSLHGDPATGSAGQANFLYGTEDPSAGAGLQADTATMYSRTYDPGGGETGELWVKTSAPDTGWAKVA